MGVGRSYSLLREGFNLCNLESLPRATLRYLTQMGNTPPTHTQTVTHTEMHLSCTTVAVIGSAPQPVNVTSQIPACCGSLDLLRLGDHSFQSRPQCQATLTFNPACCPPCCKGCWHIQWTTANWSHIRS